MPNLDALQHRLEVFREAGRNLQLDPLVTRKDLARLGVEYQPGLVDELEQAIEDCVSQDNKLIFTEHRRQNRKRWRQRLKPAEKRR